METRCGTVCQQLARLLRPSTKLILVVEDIWKIESQTKKHAIVLNVSTITVVGEVNTQHSQKDIMNQTEVSEEAYFIPKRLFVPKQNCFRMLRH